jgi:putative Mg2+ transporter-C (MgtC) family protein
VETITIPFSTWEIIGRLVLATIFGAAVGLNREWQGKPAGLRTHALVALGGALLTLVGLLLTGSDPSSAGRVIQGIVAGIGFIGAGVIMHGPADRSVHGLTTAASIWIVSAVGVATAGGLWRTGLATLVLTLIVLIGGDAVDRWIHERLPNTPR